MATVIVTLLIVSWIVGPTRGVVGGLLGGFLGAALAAGMARMAASGELAVYYTPATLARGALTLGLIAAVLALVVPYAAGCSALGWAVGATLAAIATPRTGQAVYLLPLALHLMVAVLVLGVARWSVPVGAQKARVRGTEATSGRHRSGVAKARGCWALRLGHKRTGPLLRVPRRRGETRSNP